MPTTITITGTGSPIPSAHCAGPGVLVQSDSTTLQIDAGRATVLRLAAAGVGPAALSAVLVTHHHSDHLVGLPDLVMTRWVTSPPGSVGPLPIVAPDGPSVTFLERMLDPWSDDLDVRALHNENPTRPSIDIVGFDAALPSSVVWSNDDVTVRATQVRHEPVEPAVAYRVDTPEGAIVISGDTLVCDEVAQLAEGARVLVYEAMLFEEVERWPSGAHFIMDYHADSRLIGAQAHELGIETLVLTHLIPEASTAAIAEQYMQNVRSGGFTGHVVVAKDLDTVTLDGASA